MMEQETSLLEAKKIILNITTPRGLKLSEEADMVIMRCVDGDFGVLPGHEPVSTVLGDGILRIINDGMEKKLAVFGGVVEVDNTSVNIYSTIAQKPEEIDLERAIRDREEAEAGILERTEELRYQSLGVGVRRALVRIEVSTNFEEDDFSEEG
ncbi:MAG: ATP synthase F1 subunit epsilon [Tissierellia bacterium]|mgnify:FL=1|nr:ATP synthase F1 subunit epsilon [Tissierellia bacterium]